ncbi:MAG: hypothetical protein WD669_06065 [Pirellulales bacterium]
MRISLRELMIVVAVAAVGLAALRFASSDMRPVLQLITGVVFLTCLLLAIFGHGERQAWAAGFLVCAVLYSLAAQHADNSEFARTAPSSSRGGGKAHSSFLPTKFLLAMHITVIGFDWIDQSSGELLESDPAVPFSSEESTAIQGSTDELILKAANGGTFRPGGISAGGTRQSRQVESAKRRIAVTMRGELSGIDSLNAAARDRAILRAMRNNTTYAYRPRSPQRDMVVAGHCLFALALGYIGGQFASFIYRRRVADSDRPPAL